MTRRWAGVAATVGAVAFVLAGCGQGGSGIGAAASAVLSPDVQAVRVSATQGDRAGALTHLNQLRQDVDRLKSNSQLSAGKAQTILNRADDVEALLGQVTQTTVAGTSSTARTTAPSTTVPRTSTTAPTTVPTTPATTPATTRPPVTLPPLTVPPTTAAPQTTAPRTSTT